MNISYKGMKQELSPKIQKKMDAKFGLPAWERNLGFVPQRSPDQAPGRRRSLR